jgi:prevent-host-death family protein
MQKVSKNQEFLRNFAKSLVQKISVCLCEEICVSMRVDILHYLYYSQTRQTNLTSGGMVMALAVKTKNIWQVQEAKARLSGLIKSSAAAPQIITVRGEEAAVVLSINQYREMTKARRGIIEFLQNSPLADTDLVLPRRKIEKMRETDW